MKYRHSYVVQYQDIDDTRRLRLHTMENRLLIVAGKVADEIGIGIPYLMQHNCTWIITHLNLEMLYLPTHGLSKMHTCCLFVISVYILRKRKRKN